jgi:hypothetical protein
VQKLASVLKQNDFNFAREALRIRTLIYGCDHYGVAVSYDLLANTLFFQSSDL